MRASNRCLARLPLSCVLFAPVTCAKAASLMLVPISVSSLATYCAICSSQAALKLSFNFLMSSEARSTGGT